MLVVTGATGFLGQVLVRRLLLRGLPVRAIGRNARACAHLESLGASVVRADLRDATAVAAACTNADAVVHAGALSAPFGRRSDFYATNVVGTRNVVAACTAHRVNRLVHISSPSVVFDGRDQCNAREDLPYPSRHSSHYAWSKRLAEVCVRTADLHTVILRPKAIFGAGDTALLPRLIRAARLGQLPQIGNGRNRVDLTYVENVVHAICLALEAPRTACGIYTITNGEHVELWPLIRQVLSQCGVDSRLRRIPLGAALVLARILEWRAHIIGGDPPLTRYMVSILARNQTYDITAARRDLGYAPVVSLEQGLATSLAALGPAA